MIEKIVFNKPYYNEKEVENLSDCVLNNHDYSTIVHKHLTKIIGTLNIHMTGSATSAMEAFLASGSLASGSEVIIPSFTYPAAANAVIAAGLKPVFADVDSKTLVMDIDDALKKANKKTSCIMPVHYGGASVDLDSLLKAIRGMNISIFEDAALSLGAFYKDRHLGTIGDAGVISFHKTKNFSGEGGGLLIVREDSSYRVIEEMLDSGTDRKAFYRKEKSVYSWQRPGRGVSPGTLSTAVLAAQLDKFQLISKTRKKIWDRYSLELSNLQDKGLLSLPEIPVYNSNNHHVFYILLKDNVTRENLRKTLLSNGVEAVIHYMPLHSSPYGMELGYKNSDLPMADSVACRILRLPMHMFVTEKQVEFICKKIRRTLDR